MIESYSYYPSTTELISKRRRQRVILWSALVAVVGLVFGVIGGLVGIGATNSMVAAWIVGAGAFILLAIPVIVCHNPRAGFYLLLAGAFLAEANPGGDATRIITMNIPLWLSINTVARQHGVTALEPAKISLAEILILMTIVAWVVRSIVTRDFRFERGAFFGWLSAYVVMILFGLVYGVVTGGDLTMALWEVRAQVYFYAAYLMAVNMLRGSRHVTPMLWMAALLIGVKGFVGIYSYVRLGGVTSADRPVLMHEESLFFAFFIYVLLVSAILKVDKRLTWVTFLLAPVCLFSMFENHRRASIAAFIIAFLPLLPILWFIAKERRKQIALFAICFTVAMSVYLPVAWNSDAAWALPARALRSQSQPSERDASSDYYRLAEEKNLRLTRDLKPWTGIGYGKRFGEFYTLARVTSDFQSYLPHNSVLWVWMRLGHVGFFLFLMFYASVLIKGCQFLKAVSDRRLQAAGLLTILLMLMIFTFGKYDLALTNFRVMFVAGAFVGVLAILPRLSASEGTATEPRET